MFGTLKLHNTSIFHYLYIHFLIGYMVRLSSLNKYFKRYKGKLALGVLFILISDISQVYIPLILRDSIDALQQNLSYDLIVKYSLLIF